MAEGKAAARGEGWNRQRTGDEQAVRVQPSRLPEHTATGAGPSHMGGGRPASTKTHGALRILQALGESWKQAVMTTFCIFGKCSWVAA